MSRGESIIMRKNAPVSVKKKYMFVQASKPGHEYGSSSTRSPVGSYLYVCVCVCVCNLSAPRSAIRGAPRDVCVFVHM